MMHNGNADDAALTTDVVVVGGGPVGLMLAGELRAGGVEALVLEKLVEPAGHDRAGALHTRTVEMLDLRGLLDRFLEGTQVAKGLPFAGIFSQGLNFSLLDTRHPYTALVPQSRTEVLLAEHAHQAGAEIRRGHEVTGLRQDAEGVEATVEGPRGPYRVRARYVVGCDGGRSAVRRLAGIGFPGTEATVRALIGYVATPERDVPRRWERTPDGILVLAFPPEGGTGRAVVIEYGHAPAADEGPVTLEDLNAAVARVRGTPLKLTEPVTWLSRFGDASRQAEHYRSGRVLLAGDAAHVHFPIGGQGLNTGLQDAVNLGWKLAARVRGWGSEELLDTYHGERHPVAERVLLNTRAQLALMRPDEQHTTPLRGFIEELLGIDEVNRYFGRMITGTDVRYATFTSASPGQAHPWTGCFAGWLVLSGRPEGPVPVAELLRPARPLLLDLAGRADLREAARPWADRVSVVAGEAAVEPSAQALLVRPDGYVAWAGSAADTADELRAGLARWFGPPAAEGRHPAP
ncbi:FAD-dependent monooxygenase [Streptomyces sp. NBC_01340]|uniref:FAD-dependent monooxygenase n=1 Tax=Streptomyces TaxID=1883 RepID=UPI002255C8F4|nr:MULTISPECIES: FAD-dependent monooxygenase [unclassified Streptomyces]MCX4588634.1 FAD-dependent monooxygenase [Streptomyces sp. NBC_01549]WSI41705.1 FAD-dependent monooxygenase [Streptomyces sp. NBC_01340]